MADVHTETTHHAAGQPHASWKLYVFIGLILGIITAVEVAIFYIEILASVLVPILLVLSAAKFVIVVLFYMHLRFDHPVFGRVFWFPLTLAILVVIGMIILFHVLPKYGKFA
jgi:cytochrome c oxidase subunit 4